MSLSLPLSNKYWMTVRIGYLDHPGEWLERWMVEGESDLPGRYQAEAERAVRRFNGSLQAGEASRRLIEIVELERIETETPDPERNDEDEEDDDLETTWE